MFFSTAEIDLLRLTAWCKDIPCKDTAETEVLLQAGLIRQSKTGPSFRVTDVGYSLLIIAGYKYEPDTKARYHKLVVAHRIQTAELMMFLRSAGGEVFLDHPPPPGREVGFLPSFTFRRKKASNILGGTRFSGFLYTPQTTFVPYYLTDENGGLYPASEERIFSAVSLRTESRIPTVFYTGKKELGELIATASRSRPQKRKSYTCTFAQAAEKFTCPVCYVPLSDNGARQLRIMCQPDYRTRLIKKILALDFQPDTTGRADARHKKTKAPYIIGIDCDLARYKKVISAEKKAPHIIILSDQLAAVSEVLQGENAVLHPLDVDAAEAALGISSSAIPAPVPFCTPEGGYLVVPPIKENRSP